jgi:hypothetical protein
MSTTPNNTGKKFIGGVIDTSEKFISDVNDTRDKF